MVYTKLEKKIIALCAALAVLLCWTPHIGAMHIMEGFLPAGYSLFWGALALPFVAAGIIKIKKLVSENPKALLIFAMVGAYTFVLSALKIPSVTGSSSHPTGTGLGAILFGPSPMAVVGVIVLLFQALLLAHGGVTTLGANTFSMAVAGPFLSFAIYFLCKKLRVNSLVSVFLAASFGNLFTYIVTSFQLALAHPSQVGGIAESFSKFMGIFAFTQIPLAIIEGILSVIVVIGLETWAKPELSSIGFLKGEKNR